MANSATTSDRWLFGPVPDIALGCGVAYIAVFVGLSFAGPDVVGLHPVYFAPLITLVLSGPHYGATLIRVYERSADRRRYSVFSLWATLAVIAAFGVGVHVTAFGALLFTLYITWSPWHYTGQNYGLAVMFLRRRGVPVAPEAKRWLYVSFVCSYAIVFCVLHGSMEASGYVPNPVRGTDELIALLPIGIPLEISRGLVVVASVAYLGSLAAAFRALSREASWRDLGPTAMLCATQALWFALPFSVRFWKLHTGLAPLDLPAQEYIIWIAMGHAAQYLWVTTFYARSSNSWSGYGRYLGKAFVGGAAVWTVPAILFAPGHLGDVEYAAGLGLLVAASVNLHHFILDGAIWKLRDSRVGGVLIRSVPEDAAPAPVRPWPRVLTWGVASAAAASALAIIWLTFFGFPVAVESGDTKRTRRVLDTLAFFGNDSHTARGTLAKMLAESGDIEGAEEQYRASLDLRESAAAWAGLAALYGRDGNWPDVIDVYRNVQNDELRSPALLGLVTRAFYGMQQTAEAREIVEQALAQMPATPASVTRMAEWAGTLGDAEFSAELSRRALAMAPDNPRLANRLAWLLATSVDAKVRDPEEAIRLARRAVAAADPPNPNHLDTLAASYAAAGRFDDAVETGERAVARANAAGSEQVARDAAGRLALYRAGTPYTDAPAARPPAPSAGAGGSPATR